MNHTEILSTRKFLENCHNGDMLSSDIYDFIEAKTNNDLIKLENLKGDILQFKGMLVMDVLPEVQESPKYERMEKSGEFIPIMTNVSERIRRNPEKPDQGEIFLNELQEFIEMFIPYRYANLEHVESILNDLIKHVKQKNQPILNQSSEVRWLGKELEFAELIKSLIEAKKLKGKSQKHIYEEMATYLNIKDTDKKQKLETISLRTKDTTVFLDELKEALNSWIINIKEKKQKR